MRACADGVITVEAVTLIVQIHLAQNRNDLALKEVSAARRWAQDNLLVNLAEAWVGVRLVSTPSPNSPFPSTPAPPFFSRPAPRTKMDPNQRHHRAAKSTSSPSTSSRSLPRPPLPRPCALSSHRPSPRCTSAAWRRPSRRSRRRSRRSRGTRTPLPTRLFCLPFPGTMFRRLRSRSPSTIVTYPYQWGLLPGLVLSAVAVLLEPGRRDRADVLYRKLKEADSSHAFLVDLEEKSGLFDKAAQKFSPRVSA